MARNDIVRAATRRSLLTAVVTVAAFLIAPVTSAHAAVAPSVAAVSPTFGPPAGGTRVTVTGTGFTGVSAVQFAGRAGTSLRVQSSTQLQVTSPARSAGVHNVVVVTNHGSSALVDADHFTYADPLTVSAVGPRGAPTSGGASVTVTGTGFTDVREVDFGTARATLPAGGTTPTQLVVTAPAAGAGTVDVRVVTGHATSAVTANDRFTYYTPSSAAPLQWSGPGTTDPDIPVGGGRDLSCVQASACVAVYGDRASTYDGTAWSPQARIDDHGLDAVSCGTPAFCVAVDDGGAVVTDRSGTWSGRQVLAADPLDSVSCPSSTFCVALTATDAYKWNGTAWSGPVHIYDPPTGLDVPPSSLVAVSCVSASFCLAAASNGETRLFRGSTWTAGRAIPIGGPIESGDDVADVDCVSSDFCAAVDRYNTRSFFDGTRWTGTREFAFDDTAVSITCVSSRFCIIGYEYGDGAYWNGKTWTFLRLENAEDAVLVSCRATQCAALGAAGDTLVRQGTTFTFHRQTFYYFTATDVSCVSSTFCMGVGGQTGTAGVFDGTRWGQIVLARPLGNVLTRVSCAASNFCVAVGAGGWSEVYRGTWQPPAVVGRGAFQSVSCPTSHFCVAGGSAGDVVTYNGTRWSAVTTIDSGGGALRVSCPQATFCVGTDSAGRSLTYNGTRWTAPAAQAALRGGTLSLSCASSTLCAASTPSGLSTFDGAAWSGAFDVAGTSDVSGATVSCASTTCIATNTVEPAPGRLSEWRFDGTAWSGPTEISAQGTISGLSCIAGPRCVGVSYGEYFVGAAGVGGAPRVARPAVHRARRAPICRPIPRRVTGVTSTCRTP